jgi:phage terminase large subunit-like protein
MLKFTADKYVDDVLSGEQVACKWVKLACKRYVRDLETGQERGLVFDEEGAKAAIAFFSLLKHSKGEWAGRPLILEPWQQFIVWNLFGCKRDGSDRWLEEIASFPRNDRQPVEDTRNSRRFRTCYLEVGRKNGKSTLAAGIGLYMLTADNEPGAEVYTAATKRDQARITHSEATRMVKASPALRRMVGVSSRIICILRGRHRSMSHWGRMRIRWMG